MSEALLLVTTRESRVTRRRIAHTLAVLVVCLAASLARAQSLEVIELQHRTAEDIIPILQPLLEPGAALSGESYTLFVRTSAANLRQLRAAIEQIDRQPRQLLISVRQSNSQQMESEGISASGTIRIERGAVSANEAARNRSGVTVRGTQTEDRVHGGGTASVSVLEGASAFISTGSSVPIVTMVAAGAGRGRAWGAAATEYRDLQSGFLVTPRITRDGVVLEIEQRAEQLRNGTIDRQGLTTQVSARLGEWIQLGGIEQSSTSTQRGILSREYRTNDDSQAVWVKVEVR